MNSKANNVKKSPDQSKVRKVAAETKAKSKTPAKAMPVLKKVLSEPRKSSTAIGRSERAKRRSDAVATKTSPVVDQKKAKVLAKIGRKTAVSTAKTNTVTKTSK